jgi:molybdopterin converting factor small subunit
MINISVNFYGFIRDVVDSKHVEFELPDDGTVKDIIEFLINKYGDNLKNRLLSSKGWLRRSIKMVINDSVIMHDELERRLKLNNSPKLEVTIFIFPQLGGGLSNINMEE